MRTPNDTAADCECPSCGVSIGMGSVRFDEPFRCEKCGKYVKVRASYSHWLFAVGLAAAGILSYFFGVRGPLWFLITLIAWIPVALLVFVWARKNAPPKLILCSPGEVKNSVSVLGIDEHDDGEAS